MPRSSLRMAQGEPRRAQLSTCHHGRDSPRACRQLPNRQEGQERPWPCAGSSVKDTTNQIQWPGAWTPHLCRPIAIARGRVSSATARSSFPHVLDNSHTRGDLHRTRNQRLPAGRVLIQTHPIGIARRPASRRAICLPSLPAGRASGGEKWAEWEIKAPRERG